MNRFLYNGKELQEQSGYYDYGFRQLDPQLGRWHVADAMAERTLSVSPYAYVKNDPVNNTDFMGLTFVPVTSPYPVFSSGFGWGNGEQPGIMHLGGGSFGGGGEGWSRGSGSSLGNIIAQADAEDAAWFDFMNNATYVPGAGYVNSNDVITIYSSDKGGAYFWDKGTNTLNVYSRDTEIWTVFNLDNLNVSIERNADGTTNWGGLRNFFKAFGDRIDLDNVNHSASIAGLFGLAEHVVKAAEMSKDIATLKTVTMGDAQFVMKVAHNGDLYRLYQAQSAAKGLSLLGNIMTGIAGGIYGIKSVAAFSNGNRLQGLSNGLMSFYSIIALRGGTVGKVFTTPFFLIDATVGMDNFILYNYNYGSTQTKQVQNNNWSAAFWRPGQALH